MPRAFPAALPRSLLAEPDPFDDLPPGERPPPGGDPVGPGRPGPGLRSVPALDEVARRARPTTLAVDRNLPVLEVLAGLLPDGLRRGATVGVSGTGARSMVLALVARAPQPGSGVGGVGGGARGLAAAFESGVALERLVMVDAPDPDRWAVVVGALVGAIDLVLVAPGHRPSTGDARRLSARCRERGSVLACLLPEDPSPDGPSPQGWPGRLDLWFSVAGATWSGPDAGPAGELARLRSRRVEVSVGGRGLSPAGRSDVLFLPGPHGAPARS